MKKTIRDRLKRKLGYTGLKPIRQIRNDAKVGDLVLVVKLSYLDLYKRYEIHENVGFLRDRASLWEGNYYFSIGSKQVRQTRDNTSPSIETLSRFMYSPGNNLNYFLGYKVLIRAG
jgi:hypothetical protein